jgi:HD-GYP domain-containing protein (c-di-GMP phosphodiesterase class II)
MSISESTPVESAIPRPTLVLVYPYGFDLGPAAQALDAAGIAHAAATVPFSTSVTPGQRVLYLIDYARLATLGARETVEQALMLIDVAQGASTIIVAQPGEPAASYLATNPHVGGWLTAPLDPSALIANVRTAAQALDYREEADRLRKRGKTQTRESEQLLQIGLALSSERDITKLQQLIVRSARELTNADSGSLFLIEEADGERKLRFAVAQTGPVDSGAYLGAMLPLSRASISGYVADTGNVLRVKDAYHLHPDGEVKFNNSFDLKNNYRTKSVLCVPMRDHENVVVGSLMLINRKPDFALQLQSPNHTERVVEPFSEHDEAVLASLASQAGVALENKSLLESIQDLFEQFVRASVKAIEVRDLATQGHSSRVAELTVAQAQAANDVESGAFANMYFDADQMREMRYASLLHDFGKVAVPEYIFGKAKKLPDGRLDTIRLRFLLAIEQLKTRAAHQKFALFQSGITPDDQRFKNVDSEHLQASTELHTLMESVEGANEPRVVAEGVGEQMESLIKKYYLDGADEKPLLSEEEYQYLRIPRGSLSNDERSKMEQHVTQSFLFLREIPWKKTPWPNVADYAYGHHEHLDGTGYPRGLKGLEIAPQVRMMTISDVFDALTAHDRPYKAAMPIDRALDILVKEFADRGKIDANLLDLFISKKVYEPTMAARAS